MATPKKKTSLSRCIMRRSHFALSTNAYHVCPICCVLNSPHNVCPKCGQYDGKEVITQKKEEE